MSNPVVVVDRPSQGPEDDDIDMTKTESANGDTEPADTTGLEEIEIDDTEPPKFIESVPFLKSPLVELHITPPADSSSSDPTTLHAHKSLLEQSPYFSSLLSASPTRLELVEDISALSCSLEYLYRKDYFPSLLTPNTLEHDPSLSVPDDTGISLLRHARVYTLAKKLGLLSLAAPAHRKIHLVQSTARAEIMYARYVYKHTTEADFKEVRRPVAQFWATRSHVLRHEAEQDFRETCLQFPQFGFDVLTMVLDAQERRSEKAVETSGSQAGPGRKRARLSHAS